MKKLLLFISLMLVLNAAMADPRLKITATNASLTVGQTTTVNFVFDTTVTGFDATKVNILPSNGGTLTAFTGSGTTYSSTFTKTTDLLETSIVVDNKPAVVSPADAGWVGNSFGINVATIYYMNSGASFSSSKVLAVPQPRCALPGEILSNPITPTIENFYYVQNDGTFSQYYKRATEKCLVRLQTGQIFIPDPAPKNYDLINSHGVHNHSKLMPKITNQEIIRATGSAKILVKYDNHDCTLNNNYTTFPSTYTPGAGHCTPGNWADFNKGAFRLEFVAAQMLNDDPIVYPGVKGAAHHHTFYGNSVNYQTTNATLITNCNSVAAGGCANATGYWAPSMIDTATSTALVPSTILVYYKKSGDAPITPLPQGLKIIAGNPGSTVAQPITDVEFVCTNRITNPTPVSAAFISACTWPTYNQLEAKVKFPVCAQNDGTGKPVLDSANHRSHLDYNGTPGGTSSTGATILANGCPSNFSLRIPSIEIILNYPIKKGQNTANWRLSSDNYASSSPGGYSLHADWWGGWRTEWAQRIVDQCNNTPTDCGTNYVGLNAGIAVSNITTSGNVATITTAVPHHIPVGTLDSLQFSNTAGGHLLGRISGVTGTDAAAYNFNVASLTVFDTFASVNRLRSVGTQPLTATDATHFTYTLSYTPTVPINGAVTGVLLQWGEKLCQLSEQCPADYYNTYYPLP